jgi:hypothetical protein
MFGPTAIVMFVLIAFFGLCLLTWVVLEVTRTERIRREGVRKVWRGRHHG